MSVVPGDGGCVVSRGHRDKKLDIHLPRPQPSGFPSGPLAEGDADRTGSCAQTGRVDVLSTLALLWAVGACEERASQTYQTPAPGGPAGLPPSGCGHPGLWLLHTGVCRWGSPWYLGAGPPCDVELLSEWCLGSHCGSPCLTRACRARGRWAPGFMLEPVPEPCHVWRQRAHGWDCCLSQVGLSLHTFVIFLLSPLNVLFTKAADSGHHQTFWKTQLLPLSLKRGFCVLFLWCPT